VRRTTNKKVQQKSLNSPEMAKNANNDIGSTKDKTSIFGMYTERINELIGSIDAKILRITDDLNDENKSANRNEFERKKENLIAYKEYLRNDIFLEKLGTYELRKIEVMYNHQKELLDNEIKVLLGAFITSVTALVTFFLNNQNSDLLLTFISSLLPTFTCIWLVTKANFRMNKIEKARNSQITIMDERRKEGGHFNLDNVVSEVYNFKRKSGHNKYSGPSKEAARIGIKSFSPKNHVLELQRKTSKNGNNANTDDIKNDSESELDAP